MVLAGSFEQFLFFLVRLLPHSVFLFFVVNLD